MYSDASMLIAVRVVVVTTLLMASLIFQYTAAESGRELLVETLLIYFTGGLDSPFSFLYLVSIITASMLLYRRGGLLTASGAVILYGGLGDLMFYGILKLPEQTWFIPTPWT